MPKVGYHHTEESKAKMRLTRRGKLLSLVTRTRMSVAKKGHKQTLYKQTEEGKLKIGLANKGKTLSDETKCKISIANSGNVACCNHTSFQKGHIPPVGVRNKISESNKGRVQTKEEKERRAESLTGRTVSEETRLRIAESNRGKIVTEETRQRMSVEGSVRWQKDDYRQKMLLILKETHDKYQCNSEFLAKLSDDTKRLWQTPEYVIKQVIARGTKPNKAEGYLGAILKECNPNFEYNGDGRLGIALAGLVPDFVNVNGEKQVIELFGEYWHKIKGTLKWHQTEVGRIEAYKTVGWDCLIIWEKELKKPDKVKDKIKEFVGA